MSFKDFPYGYSGDAAGTTDSWFEDVLYSTPKRPSEEEEIQSRLREDRIAKEVVRRQALIKDAGLDRYYDGAVIAFKKGKLTFVSFKMKDKWYTTGKLSVALEMYGKDLPADPKIEDLVNLYVRFHKEAEARPERRVRRA